MGILAVLCATVHLVAAVNTDDGYDPLFSPGSVQHFRIQIGAEAAAALRLHPRTYVKAEVVAGTNVCGDIGLHLEGNYGTFQNVEGKPSLTLKFDKFTPGQEFYGQNKIHLNNSSSDPSYLAEMQVRTIIPTSKAWPP